jgi:hypothetical protein
MGIGDAMTQITYAIAHAAAWDSANRRAKKEGRTVWNEDDYNHAVDEFNRLWPIDNVVKEK